MFALPPEFHLEALRQEAAQWIAVLRLQMANARCTVCQHEAWRVHSSYTRTLGDLPCSGHVVVVQWQVRKFFCANQACPRRIFTEQVPTFAAPSARMTHRLMAALQAIARACGGNAGSRLAQALAMPTSAPTLLRRLLAIPLPVAPQVRFLGVDDWAWKKRKRYGTVLVDHERGAIIDVLPDRSAETFATWLTTHPEVAVITRDRASEYARAAKQAAPQAQQVADRFHLVRNWVEMLTVVFARCRAEIRGPHADPILPQGAPPPLPTPAGWKPINPRQSARTYDARDAHRANRYEQILSLRSQQLTWDEIAQRVGLSQKTIRGWIVAGGPPPHASRGAHRAGKFGPFAAYALERWQAGVQEGTLLYPELKARGYRGNLRTVQRYLQALRRDRRPIPLGPPSAVDAFDARKVAWLVVRREELLSEAERQLVCASTAASATFQHVYELTQQFMTMVRQRQGDVFLPWLAALEATPFPECQRFADGIRRDFAATAAAMSHPLSNGRTEGCVNKLKLLKRQMYGRAGFALLRHRLLLAD